MKRTTLTKSLHTVTAVSMVARFILQTNPLVKDAKDAVLRALYVLDQTGPWPVNDPTVLACITATEKLA